MIEFKMFENKYERCEKDEICDTDDGNEESDLTAACLTQNTLECNLYNIKVALYYIQWTSSIISTSLSNISLLKFFFWYGHHFLTSNFHDSNKGFFSLTIRTIESLLYHH